MKIFTCIFLLTFPFLQSYSQNSDNQKKDSLFFSAGLGIFEQQRPLDSSTAFIRLESTFQPKDIKWNAPKETRFYYRDEPIITVMDDFLRVYSDSITAIRSLIKLFKWKDSLQRAELILGQKAENILCYITTAGTISDIKKFNAAVKDYMALKKKRKISKK